MFKFLKKLFGAKPEVIRSGASPAPVGSLAWSLDQASADMLVSDGPTAATTMWRSEDHPPLWVRLRFAEPDVRHNLPTQELAEPLHVRALTSVEDTKQIVEGGLKQRIKGLVKLGEFTRVIILEYDWATGSGNARIYGQSDRQHQIDFPHGLNKPGLAEARKQWELTMEKLAQLKEKQGR